MMHSGACFPYIFEAGDRVGWFVGTSRTPYYGPAQCPPGALIPGSPVGAPPQNAIIDSRSCARHGCLCY